MTTDRLFVTALVLSLVGHAVVLGAELIMPGWGGWSQAIKPLKLVYEPATTQEPAQLYNELKHRREGFSAPPGPSSAPAVGTPGEGYQPAPMVVDVATLTASVHVGEIIGAGGASLAAGRSGAWQAAIDLTNLAAAAQGDPVLYTYFGALREQIQQTANAQGWLPEEAANPGTVYVGFVVTRTGAIASAGVVLERSVDSPLLQQVALRIVKASSPFVAFPPSFKESSMAIVVPLEFAEGPANW